jgi:hypothetical protein
MVSAYNIFVKENYKSLSEKNKELKMIDISSKIGKIWKSLSDTEKAVYKKKADAVIKVKKPTVVQTKAKKPLNAYMKFVKAKRSEVVKANPNLKATEIAKKLGSVWRALDDNEKAKYK